MFDYKYKEAEQGNGYKGVVKGRKASWSSTTGTICGTHRVSYGFLLYASLTETTTQRKYKKITIIRRKQGTAMYTIITSKCGKK